MPRGKGPIGTNDKPKNFGKAITRLLSSIKRYKVLVIISLVLASFSSVLSLVSPNRLSDLTDEISKGLGINITNMEIVQKDIFTNLDKDKLPETMTSILDINFSEETIYKVNTSNISEEDKNTFMEVLTKINNDRENSLLYLNELPDSVLSIILSNSTYNEVEVSTEDKISLIRVLSSIDINSKDISYIDKLPDSIKEILFPSSKIKGVLVSTNDKVELIKVMSKMDENTTESDMYKLLSDIPSSISKIISPKMDMKKIKTISLILAIIYIVSALFSYVQGILMVNVANRSARRLRNEISVKINKLPLKYFDHNLNGDILSRVTNDVDTIAQSLNQSLATLVSSLTLFIGSIIMMFITNYIMAITAILSSLIGFMFMALILGKSQKYFTRRQEELGKLNGYIEEIYSGLNVVKTCNAKESSLDKFNELNSNLYECNQKSQFLSGLMHPLMGFIGNFGYVAVCVVGALLVSKDMISFGTIVAFIMYVRLFSSPLSQIAQAMTSLQSTAAASERVFDFLEEEEMTEEVDKKHLNKNKVKGKIEFKDVWFGYDEDKDIIKGFTAVAKPGQKIAIVGPTGAGKTTMVNLLMKFYDINKGDILIDGTSIKEITRENIHELFTMVLQDTWLFNGSIRDNISYNRENTSMKKIKEVCQLVGVDHFIKTLPNGYDSIISDNDSVSSGQRQLLTIARGMIEDAPFLILDEATSNVDTRTEELVQKAMDKLMENKTSFIIAHRLSTIKNADLILVMKAGNIIETGNHNTLMKKNGFYAELYNSQFDSLKEI